MGRWAPLDSDTFKGSFCQKELIKGRGWTRGAIKRELGEPDRRVPLNRLKKYTRQGRPECRYDAERVLKAEEDGKQRIRRGRGGPLDGFIAELKENNWLRLDVHKGWVDPDGNPIPSDGPMRSRLFQLAMRFGADEADIKRKMLAVYRKEMDVRYPWRVDVVTLTADGVIRLSVSHKYHEKFPCPKCRKSCGVYDHLPETVLRYNRDLGVELIGRRPRIECLRHGVQQVKRLRGCSADTNFPDQEFMDEQPQWVFA
jgi:hypothetical protein